MSDSSSTGKWQNQQVRQLLDGMYHQPDSGREIRAVPTVESIVRLAGDVPHERLLEIGCGEGSVLAGLSQLGFSRSLCGIDISSSAIDVTRKRNIPGVIDCQLYDGYAIPYPDHHFDLAVFASVLEYAEHPRELLQRAARSAKHVYLMAMVQDTMNQSWDFQLKHGFINYWTPRSLRWLCQSSGLKVLKQETFLLSRSCCRKIGGIQGEIKWALKTAALKLAPRLSTTFMSYQTALLLTADPA